MGDWFQTIADIDASLDEAELLASQIRDWLIERNIVDATLKDCALSSDGQGYPPGLNYEQAVNIDPRTVGIRTLWINGLAIEVGRRVFHNGQSGVTITCPQCQAACPDVWGEAISEWYESKGEGLVTCIGCGNTQPITEWTFFPQWGFGNLGFTFWNWDPLKQSFIDEFAQRLKPHRIVFIADKL